MSISIRRLPTTCALLLRSVAAPSARFISGGSKAFDARERAAETLYFNKEEERLMRGLLSKVKVRPSHSTSDATPEVGDGGHCFP